jgi:lysophospholipase L1-like esterase
MSLADVQAMRALKMARETKDSLALNVVASPTVVKDMTPHTLTGSYKLYIPNVPLKTGYLKIHYKAVQAELGYFYILTQTGLTFTVQKVVTANLSVGENVIDTGFTCVGDGTEFVGFYAHNYYKTSGGTGMWESSTNILQEGQSLTTLPITNGAQTFDFGMYYEYITQTLAVPDIVNDLKSYVNALNKSVFNTSAPNLNPTVTKDFSQYSLTGLYKIYIPNIPLQKGNLKIHFKGAQAETAYFYIFKINGTNFTVLKSITASLLVGDNVIDTGYSCAGDGTEYVGFYAHNYYKSSGGKGMYEATGAVLSNGQVLSATNSTTGISGTYDFACYYTYTTGNLSDSVTQLQAQVATLQSGGTSSVSLTDYFIPRYSELSGQSIGYLGRWFDKTINSTPCKVTINEGSEFYFKVKGTTTINVNFQLITSLTTPYFAYSIDGAALTRQLITNPLLPTVTTGEHIVRIVCDGLTETENKWTGEIGFAVSGVTVDVGGTVTGILPKNRTIMFFGDSITEGIRVLNMNANSDGNSGSGAYPYVTCANLNAISYRVGFGATGVTRGGSGGVPNCLQYIDNMTSTRPAPYFEPDAIVINHGTNDGGADSATFTAAYNAILDRLRIKYPGVPIFPMIPFNQAHAQDIRGCIAGRKYCYLVETSGWPMTYTDGLHPDSSGGTVAGGNLATAITAVLGKDFFTHN